MASLFEQDIQFLKGVGSKRRALFEKISAPTIGALLRLYPRAYEDFSNPYHILEAPTDVPCCIKAIVSSKIIENKIRKGLIMYKVRISDQTACINVTFFNNKYTIQKLKYGEEFLFFGKIKRINSKIEMNSPHFIPISHSKTIRPIYSQTYGLASHQIENAVKQAMLLLPKEVKDPIPEYIRRKYSLCDLRFSIENIHFPINNYALQKAKERLTFEELLNLQIGLSILKSTNYKQNKFTIKGEEIDEFVSLLSFSLTNAQSRVIKECIDDMKSNKTMHRLIQGDVGSGKTVVAAALCYSIVKSGFQAAIMVPTEILAEQHYNFFKKIFSSVDVNITLLTGSTLKSKKRLIKDMLETGVIDIIIGTHSLISDDIYFSKLGLVITDEQHRFGVSQRAKLASKGDEPHVLVMSATPIPRTLAMIIYGDVDISIIDEMPPGRQKIDTYLVDSSKRVRIYKFIKKLIDEGRQAYIVCPLIEKTETSSNLIAAESYAQELKSNYFKEYNVGLMHGKMNANEKNYIMSKFLLNNINILVSTTVIEVGVDVPNSTVMLIENADQFGLSQLHQLRGRVGRGKYKSYCIMISDSKSQETVTRLRAICQTNDGLKIADEDLKLRGPGDFLGSRQHGLPDLKLAGLMKNINILKDAKNASDEILSNDPELSKEENKTLKAEIKRLFPNINRGYIC